MIDLDAMHDEVCARERIQAAACSLEGTVYLWAGNRPRDGGLDCSGFVQWSWFVAGLHTYTRDRTAQMLFDELKATDDPLPGDAAFYSSTPNGRISHVVLLMDSGEIIGANGGDRPLSGEWSASGGWASDAARATYLDRMRERKACVRTAPSPEFRHYLRGYRRAPTL